MQTNSKFKSATVYSGANCPWCERAKALLDSKGIPYTVKTIGVDITKDEFFAAIPGARTVPQVFLDGNHVGGFELLTKALDK